MLTVTRQLSSKIRSSGRNACSHSVILEAEVALNTDELSRMGWTSTLTVLPYGDKFRKHRRLMQEYFRPRALPNYYPLIELEVAIFIEELVKTPKNFRIHFRRYARAHCGECRTLVTLS